MSRARDSFIRAMREEKKWIVVPKNLRDVSMHRKIGKHRISVHLEGLSNGSFRILPANYVYRSRMSHWDYPESEVRWSRNKKTFKAIVSSLRSSRAVDFIDNLEDFIEVNANNRNSDKRKVGRELSHLLEVREVQEAAKAVA
jgi:hypothetical protein